jgi:hypothetical protein
MSPALRRWWLPVALFAALALAGLAPIRSYDFFWHLASGRWITEQGALPRFDPFAVASDRTDWINGEWLWQVLAYTNYRIGGLTTIWLMRAIEGALIFTLGYVFARRDDVDGVALIASVIAFAGAHERLDARPSSAAALLTVAAIAVLERGARSPAGGRRLRGGATLLYVLMTIAWINIHPSAILAPVIALFLTRDITTTAASALALLVNPFGWRAIANPIALTMYARSGAFVNAEWLPSPPLLFPLLYITIAVAIAVFILAENRRGEIGRVILFAMFAYLAVSHVRNQGLYFAAFPLLVAPQFRRAAPTRILVAAACAIVIAVALTTSHAAGVDVQRFPIRAVDALKRSPFNRGNVYNPDQFGGFLIWSFYPQRRALTDGRNELYHAYIPEYARARVDSRAWHALLQKYRIDVAVDEYRPPLDIVNALTRQHTTMPASLAYFPRRQWALIAYDDAAMVFVRRAAFTAADVDRYELKGVVPDR